MLSLFVKLNLTQKRHQFCFRSSLLSIHILERESSMIICWPKVDNQWEGAEWDTALISLRIIWNNLEATKHRNICFHFKCSRCSLICSQGERWSWGSGEYLLCWLITDIYPEEKKATRDLIHLMLPYGSCNSSWTEVMRGHQPDTQPIRRLPTSFCPPQSKYTDSDLTFAKVQLNKWW